MRTIDTDAESGTGVFGEHEVERDFTADDFTVESTDYEAYIMGCYQIDAGPLDEAAQSRVVAAGDPLLVEYLLTHDVVEDGVLDAVLAHADPRVRAQALVALPVDDERRLHLASDPDLATRRQVAASSHLDLDLVERLSLDPSKKVVRTLMANPALPPGSAVRLSFTTNALAAELLATRPGVQATDEFSLAWCRAHDPERVALLEHYAADPLVSAMAQQWKGSVAEFHATVAKMR